MREIPLLFYTAGNEACRTPLKVTLQVSTRILAVESVP